MTYPVPFGQKSGNLGPRSRYFDNSRPISSDFLEKSHERLKIELLYHPGGPGEAGSYENYRKVEDFELMITRASGVTFSEANQPVLTAEAEKMFIFYEIIPILSLNGVIYDTSRDWETRGGKILPGRGVSALNSFYERARVSQIAKNKMIVRVSIAGEVYWGGFINKAVSRNSQNDHMATVTLTFLVAERKPAVSSPVEAIPGVDAVGRITSDGASLVGLLATQTSQVPRSAPAGGVAGPAFSREQVGSGSMVTPDSQELTA